MKSTRSKGVSLTFSVWGKTASTGVHQHLPNAYGDQAVNVAQRGMGRAFQQLATDTVVTSAGADLHDHVTQAPVQHW